MSSGLPETASPAWEVRPELADELDAADPLSKLRERFHLPRRADGGAVRYFCGNSLGLMPRAAREFVDQELADWRDLAVDAHFDGRTPWYSYHTVFEESAARLVGAQPGEAVLMNSLTSNLHLLMVSFYRPQGRRTKILIEEPAFPSDNYAVASQLRFHGLDPAEALVRVRPRANEQTLRTEDIETVIAERGEEIALVLLGGVNYLTGQLLDLARLTAAARAAGCAVGYDLAHAAGNVELRLHEWRVDFAVWCNYKYLNGGPGTVGACFVHDRHGGNAELPRLAGWWGNDPDTRFRMHLESEFVPHRVAEGWQLSNPPILALAPLRASYALFDEVGMPALRERSLRLTGYLEFLLEQLCPDIEIITPRDPAARGCQLSLRLGDGARGMVQALGAAGCVCDFRPPDVLRVAPVPLYNSFRDVRDLVDVLVATAGGERRGEAR